MNEEYKKFTVLQMQEKHLRIPGLLLKSGMEIFVSYQLQKYRPNSPKPMFKVDDPNYPLENNDYSNILDSLKAFIVKKGNCELKNVYFLLISEYNYRYLKQEESFFNDKNKVVDKIGAIVDLILKEKDFKMINDHLKELDNDLKLKEIRISDEALQTWEEINEASNKLWAKAKGEQKKNEIDEFMSAEAAYFWVTNIRENCITTKQFLEILKSYLSKTLPESQSQKDMFNLIEEILFNGLFETVVNSSQCDEFFLRLSSFINELGSLQNYIKCLKITKQFEGLKARPPKSDLKPNSNEKREISLFYREGEPLFFKKDSEIKISLNNQKFELQYWPLIPGREGSQEEKMTVTEKFITFGRALAGQNIQNNPIIDLKEKTISKLHFQISFQNDNFYISCLSPTNPTLLRLRKEKIFTLENDMVINLGLQHFFRIEISNFSKPTSSENENSYSNKYDAQFSGSKETETFKPNPKVSKINLFYFQRKLPKSEEAKGPYFVEKEITIGNNKSSTIVMNDEEYVEDKHCKIFYSKPDKKWIIEHLGNGDNDTFVLIKNHKEYLEGLKLNEEYRKLPVSQMQEKPYKDSKAKLLKSGMEIFLSYQVFEVK